MTEKLEYTNIFESITDDKTHAAYLQLRSDTLMKLIDILEIDDAINDGYDEWFRSKVKEAMESYKPRVPHKEAVKRLMSLIDTE